MSGCSQLGLQGASDCSLSLDDLLLGILNLVLHLILVDLELNLALVLEFWEHHKSLIVISLVQQRASLIDLLWSLHRLLNLVDRQRVVHLLLRAVSQLLKALEVDHCWLHIVLSLLLLLLELLHILHSHEILHLHEVVGDHAELLILRIIATSLRIEHHLHVHVRVDIIHTLTWEAHLILHHHTRELVHVLHAVHADGSGHILVHTIILSHLRTSRCAIIGSQLVVAVRIRALVAIFAVSACNQKQINLKLYNLALQARSTEHGAIWK